ncbi:cobalt/nickel transport protein [Raineyella antarctica]|uniref:Cobalt/nickel transport protein n=1 Tax=Raineyella antarctica TaxID=1577474 RepID=A0A1G6GEY7_9ACTN|nr:energy-coupling factor ABC transporter substrate-binding protein [Raineyella antarctica]SDB80568.1 cobalt/nickel transport protein [Raineyella antarctica]
MPEARTGAAAGPRAWVTWALLGLVVVLLVATFALARAQAPGTQFAGSDSTAVQVLQDQGARPWFTPIFQPGSREIESGLFAAQAALGGAVLGWALGRLQSRREIRRLREQSSAAAQQGAPQTAPETAPEAATGTAPTASPDATHDQA